MLYRNSLHKYLTSVLAAICFTLAIQLENQGDIVQGLLLGFGVLSTLEIIINTIENEADRIMFHISNIPVPPPDNEEVEE